jgi:rod shape-determining protein MreC
VAALNPPSRTNAGDDLTSGDGGIFPKGLPVGRIIDTRPANAGLFTTARIRLGANLNRLEEVWVLQSNP